MQVSSKKRALVLHWNPDFTNPQYLRLHPKFKPSHFWILSGEMKTENCSLQTRCKCRLRVKINADFLNKRIICTKGIPGQMLVDPLSINILDWSIIYLHFDRFLVNTRPTLNQPLDRHLINSWPSVDRLILIDLHLMAGLRKLFDSQPTHRSSVDRMLRCVDRGYWSTLDRNVFRTHDRSIYWNISII